MLGMTKTIGSLTIMVGPFPRNDACVSIRFDDVDATVITNAQTHADIEAMERLLGNSMVDHDDVEYVDEDDFA
jgi:hypothetical protein